MTAALNTLANSFHNTEYRTRKTDAEIDALEGRLANGNATSADKAFVRTVRAALCGSADCTCGDFIGRRY